MNRYLTAAVIALALTPAASWGADAESEIMMSVVGSEEADEETFVDEIQLPSRATDQGERNAESGTGAANGPADPPGAAAAREAAREARRQGQEAREVRGPPEHAGGDRRPGRSGGGPGGDNPGRNPGDGSPGQGRGRDGDPNRGN